MQDTEVVETPVPRKPPEDHAWRDWGTYRQRYRAYNPQGVYVETVRLSRVKREMYEARGWTFAHAGYPPTE